MIDRMKEKLIPLVDASAAVAAGIAIGKERLRCWAREGVRGHKLETVKIGGRVMTSVEAVARFIDAINGTKANA